MSTQPLRQVLLVALVVGLTACTSTGSSSHAGAQVGASGRPTAQSALTPAGTVVLDDGCRNTASESASTEALAVHDVWPGGTQTGHTYTTLSLAGCHARAASAAPFCQWLAGWNPSPQGKGLLASLGVVTMKGAKLVGQGGSSVTEVILTVKSARQAREVSAKSQSCLGVGSADAAPAAGKTWASVDARDDHVVAVAATGVPPARAGGLMATALNLAAS